MYTTERSDNVFNLLASKVRELGDSRTYEALISSVKTVLSHRMARERLESRRRGQDADIRRGQVGAPAVALWGESSASTSFYEADPIFVLTGSSISPGIRYEHINDVDLFILVRRGHHTLQFGLRSLLNGMLLHALGPSVLPTGIQMAGAYENDTDILTTLRYPLRSGKTFNIIIKLVDEYPDTDIGRARAVNSLLSHFDFSVLGKAFYSPLSQMDNRTSTLLKTNSYNETIHNRVIEAANGVSNTRKAAYSIKYHNTIFTKGWELL